MPEQFSSRKVQRELVEVLLENARWAPTHRLTQPWRFHVFMGEGLQTLADWQSETYKAITPEDEFQPHKYKKLSERPLMASAVVAIVMKRDEEKRVPEIEEIAAVAAAVENMFITCSAYGLAGYWGSGGMTYTQELKDWLKLGDEDRCMGFFYLGYPEEWPRQKPRVERRLFTEWITQ
jgi:nitroreductase